ncbi:MAG: NADH:flavin oxidoreductase [Planctomycetota bacterium]|nr:MAG: NADH:flavin oxidoreductase [Planctomycetota bacterium]
MEYTPPGRHKTLAAFRAHWRAVAPDLDCDPELEGAAGPLGRPLAAFGRVLGNRFAIHPMEGWDGTGDGLPSEHTVRRWRRFGRSGARLLWGGEAFAVASDGRANQRQLFLNPQRDMVGALARLRESARAGAREMGDDPDALCIGLQLTHSGRYACVAPRRAVAHPVLDARGGAGARPLLSDGELEGIGAHFVSAADAARQAGFDFVDLKACHGYLLHELLGARARPGPYGGDFDGRTRFFRRVLASIASQCPGLRVAARVSVGDVIPYLRDPVHGRGAPAPWPGSTPYAHGFGVSEHDPAGFDLAEPLRFLAVLAQLGVREVSVTLGSPYYCPHLQRPATYPPSDGYLPPEDPLLSVARHLRAVRACKAAQRELVLVGAGYSYLQEYLAHVAQFELRHGHVDLVGLGRMVLAYPELPRDVLAGRPPDRRRLCRTFSDCTSAPRNGLISGCYPLDEHYRALPEAARLAHIKRGERAG